MPLDPITGPDYGRLKSTLANSKWQSENNAGYQTILGIIDGLKTFQDIVSSNFQDTVFNESLATELAKLNTINVVEVDTSSGPTSFSLNDYVNHMTIFKDVTGNAAGNNITLLGTVEGVVDPVISTNFGFFHVYVGITDGLFHTW